jgi:acetolactate synthase-1/2/3 large subunit
MEELMPVDEGAEAFVELLNANGVDYIFLNPGSDTFPVQEALSKFKALGKHTPEVILCLDESVAMAAAHGYAMVSGRPQVVLVHVDVGTQQVGGALHNAQRGRIPVILCAGRSPSTFKEDKRGGRSHYIQWLQEQYDQAGVVRNYVKWEYELRHNENIDQVVHRAFQIATTDPQGPVYLSLPRELLMEKMTKVRLLPAARYAAASTPQADMGTLSKVAEILLQAEEPLIITGYSGRHQQSVASLVELAETLGIRVVTAELRMNFPTRHHLCAGTCPVSAGINPNPYLKDADVILVIDHDVPYVPAQDGPRPDAKIIHIDIDPIKQGMPLWGLPVDVLIEADSSKVLPALNEIICQRLTPEQQTRFRERFQRLDSEHQKLRAKWHALAMSKAKQKPISAEWLCYCINEVIDEDTIILDEVITDSLPLARQLHRSKPGTLFASGGACLGWGLGAALGAKLAALDKMVVSLTGDGSFVFGCPTAALWAASVHHAPFLSIIFNNQMYYAPKRLIRRVYGGDSFSEKTGFWVGVDITPSPDYALIAQACHAYGQRVEDPSELLPTLRDALDRVRRGTPAVVDVRLERP